MGEWGEVISIKLQGNRRRQFDVAFGLRKPDVSNCETADDCTLAIITQLD